MAKKKDTEETTHFIFPRKNVIDGLHQDPFPVEAEARPKANNKKMLPSGNNKKKKEEEVTGEGEE